MGNSALPFHWYDAKVAYLHRVAKFCAIFLMGTIRMIRIMGIMVIADASCVRELIFHGNHLLADTVDSDFA